MDRRICYSIYSTAHCKNNRVASDLIFSNPAGAGFWIADPARAGAAGAECS